MAWARVTLVDEPRRETALRAVQSAPLGLVVTVDKEVRNKLQNDALHALLADLVKGMPFYAGERMDLEDWKSVMVLAMDKHEGKPSRAVPGLEGGVVVLRRSTAKMGKSDLTKLIEYTEIYMTKYGIPIRDKHHVAA